MKQIHGRPASIVAGTTAAGWSSSGRQILDVKQLHGRDHQATNCPRGLVCRQPVRSLAVEVLRVKQLHGHPASIGAMADRSST